MCVQFTRMLYLSIVQHRTVSVYVCMCVVYIQYIHTLLHTHMYSSKVGAHFELQLLIGHFFKDSI